MIITLIGMMGVGKTTVGKQLSRDLNWSFYDIDEIIRSRTGKDISEIFFYGSDLVFRHWERKIIAEVFTKNSQGIIAPGGGAILSRNNRKLFMKEGAVFYLAADIDEILNRVNFSDRPLLNQADNPEKKIKELYMQRRELYKMGNKIDTTNLTVDETVETIKRKIK